MKKGIAILMISIVCLTAAAGCGNKQSAGPDPTNGQTTPSTPSNGSSSNKGSSTIQATPSSSGGKSSSTSTTSKTKAVPTKTKMEKALPPETHPVGDIPDSQVFISYSNTQGGYSFDAPEGWARTLKGSNVSFVHNFDGISVKAYTQSQAPTVKSVQNQQVKALDKTGRAVKILGIKNVTLKNEKAILVKYNSNSAPNKVTNKQVRQENERFYYYKNGKVAELTLWAPLGADNVDQWRRISNSFRWKK